MTPSQVAKRLGYRSVGSVRALIDCGTLQATYQVVQGKRYYDITEAALRHFEANYQPIQRGKPRGIKQVKKTLKKS
jgi:hypothetical protein